MNKYLSIGEIAKLSNISPQTLRHYESLGIMYPSYINGETGYRYYSMEDLITIGLIKQCRAIGLPLNEIKELIANYTSLESILSIIGNQKKLINDKIKELEFINNQISGLESKIAISIEKGLNEVFVKYNEERKCLEFDYSDRNAIQFELDLRKALIIAEKKYKNATTEIVFTVPYNDIEKEEQLNYKNVMLNLGKEINCKNENIITIPEGDYLTMYFDDVHRKAYKYYKIIIDYIKDNNVKIKGDFRETYILTRKGIDGRIKSLGKIQILIDLL